MLDVRRMRVLREVAARGSFSAAAEALNFTQSAVSQQVAALERESGSKLVERGARGIRLTDAGRALVDHADAILARLDEAEQELAAIAGLRGGHLRLESFQSAGATLVPRALGEFHSRYPNVELSVATAENEDAHDALRAGEIDIAIVMDFEWLPLLAPDIELTQLLVDPYRLILPGDHRLAAKRSVALAELASEPWIVPMTGFGCREGIIGSCRAAGFEARVAIESDENEQTQAFVAAGLGVALWPQLALAAVHPGVVVKPLSKTRLERRVYSATLRDSYCSAAAEAMIATLCEVAREFAPTGRLRAA